MKTKHIILIFLIITPFFFLKSSNLNLYGDYPDLSIKSSNAFIIDKTVYSFQDSFNITAEAYGYSKKELKLSHQSPLKTIVLDEKDINVKFRINPNIKPLVKINNTFVKFDDSVFLKKGEHELNIVDEGFLPINKKFVIDEYTDQLIVPIIQEKINKELLIKSKPSNAKFYINNELIGVTPLSISLNTLENKISIEKENYQTENFTIISDTNEPVSRLISLKPAEKLVEIISTPSKAAVFIDNIYKGITPLSIKNTSNGRLLVKKDGFISIEMPLSSNTINLKLDLKPDESIVAVNSNPSSDFYLNDELIGKTPLDVNIQKITNKLTFKRNGYKTQTFYYQPNKSYENLSQNLITLKQDAINNSPFFLQTKMGFKLILFEPGKVTLGSDKSQSRRDINEVRRNVVLSKHFYISENLVSEKLYSMYDPTLSSSSNLPINNISWIDAAKFCNWLSEREGLTKFYEIKSDNLQSFNLKSNGYRLPSEAEWEYVAKTNADQELIYTWGSDRSINSMVGNIGDESASGLYENYIKNYDDGYDMRSPVGKFAKNQNGVKDLTGNLSEWVNDFYSAEIVSPDMVFTDFMGPKYGSVHVIKGSNYSSSLPVQLGISYRGYGQDAESVVGFRVARWIY